MDHIFEAPMPRVIFGGDARLLFAPKRLGQLLMILICALTLKQFYSTANVNELRWILAPTTVLVELVSSSQFEFESYAGYIKSDHTFIIAASCAGVNFMLAAFLMLSLGKLWRDRAHNLSWSFIPAAVAIGYLTTLIANTVRIVIALRLRAVSPSAGWLNADQLHRLEGIFVYFGFLLLLYVISERLDWRVRIVSAQTQPVEHERDSANDEELSLLRNLMRTLSFPLLIYYAITLGIPLATAVYRPGVLPTDFWNHLLFVLLTPLTVILPIAAFSCYKAHVRPH